MDMQDEKYQRKSKSISSAEPNYFVHFAMRYPVIVTSPQLYKRYKNLLIYFNFSFNCMYRFHLSVLHTRFLPSVVFYSPFVEFLQPLLSNQLLVQGLVLQDQSSHMSLDMKECDEEIRSQKEFDVKITCFCHFIVVGTF